ncbi:MAG: nucleotidyltransferase family protein [Bacteroidetes bacterium]|nr:nucleotidyltransferase family protein [Bacteroidota bacterium]
MKAMILAAGLGTRLRPFTLDHPKALFEIEGKTLLAHAIDHIRAAGISEILINVHHFADQIIDYLELNQNFGCSIAISDETGELLETGGGLKKAAWFFDQDDDFIVRNVDILSDLDLPKMVLRHKKNRWLATLAIRDRQTSRYFLFNNSMKLGGWENRKTGEKVIVNPSTSLNSYAFSGIQVLNAAIFPLISEEGKFSLTSLYLRLADSQPIFGYQEDGLVWKDVGNTLNAHQ